MTNRSSALFTSSQREGLLRGLSSEASDRKLRQRIRTRIRDSAVDLQLGFRRLDDEDFSRAFQSNREPINEFRKELEDFSQNNRVFLNTFEEVTEDVSHINDTLTNLEDSHYDYSRSMMEFEKSGPNIFDTDQDPRKQRRDLESLLDKLQSEVNHLQRNAQRLRELDEENWDRLQRFRNKAEQFEVVFGEDSARLNHWIEKIEERNTASKQLVDLTDKLSNWVDELGFTDVDQIDEWESQFNEVSSVIQELEDVVDTLRAGRNHMAHRGSPRYAFRDLSRLSFDPGMRDTVVDSIAFFLRAASIVGADTEQILEEAITTNIQTRQNDRVLDTVDVTIETENRSRALQSAEQKHSYEQFSNAELRAILQSDTGRLGEMTAQMRPSHQDLIDRILEDPSCIEPGFEITAMQVPIEYYDLEFQVDLVGRDSNDDIVLIEAIESASTDRIERKMNQLNALLEQADLGEEQHSRGLVVVDTVTKESEAQHTLDSARGRVDIIQIE